MRVPFLRPFPGNEAHKLFSVGPKSGVLGGGQKVYVEKVYVFFFVPYWRWEPGSQPLAPCGPRPRLLPCFFLLCLLFSAISPIRQGEGQKRHQILAPVLAMTSSNSLVFSREIITNAQKTREASGWLCVECIRGFSRKTSGKSRGNFGKMFTNCEIQVGVNGDTFFYKGTKRMF